MLRILTKIQRTGILTEDLPRSGEPALQEIGARLKTGIGTLFSGSLAIRDGGRRFVQWL